MTPATPPAGADVEAVRCGNATYYVRQDVDAEMKRLRAAMSAAQGPAMIRTWHIEAAVVAIVLAVVATVSGGGVEFIGAAAVLGAFMHGQIADRLHEQQRVRPTVECRRWMWRYWVGKELLFIAYFIAHRSYAAVAGAALFALYPLWRKWWRSPIRAQKRHARSVLRGSGC